MARSKSPNKSKRSGDSSSFAQEQIDTAAKDKMISMQMAVNQYILDFIVNLQNDVQEKTENESHTINLLISGVATNLGVILAGLPDDMRKEYITISNTIIEKSMKNALEAIAGYKYGQIGHA